MNFMKHSMDLHTVKIKKLCAAGAILLIALAAVSLFTGKYPLTLEGILSGDPMQTRVFWTLRVGRTAVGVIGGFALGTAGFVYQTVFRNPLASPDVIGVSSGASAGAAAGILFLSGAASVTAAAFAGALAAVTLALALSSLDRAGRNGTIVLAGADGIVAAARHSQSYGNYLRLSHTEGEETLYAHMQYLSVRTGEVVKAGEPIGTVGQTGRATGAHLHLEWLCNGIRYDPAGILDFL